MVYLNVSFVSITVFYETKKYKISGVWNNFFNSYFIILIYSRTMRAERKDVSVNVPSNIVDILTQLFINKNKNTMTHIYLWARSHLTKRECL